VGDINLLVGGGYIFATHEPLPEAAAGRGRMPGMTSIEYVWMPYGATAVVAAGVLVIVVAIVLGRRKK
jgi:hypothetical protein